MTIRHTNFYVRIHNRNRQRTTHKYSHWIFVVPNRRVNNSHCQKFYAQHLTTSTILHSTQYTHIYMQVKEMPFTRPISVHIVDWGVKWKPHIIDRTSNKFTLLPINIYGSIYMFDVCACCVNTEQWMVRRTVCTYNILAYYNYNYKYKICIAHTNEFPASSKRLYKYWISCRLCFTTLHSWCSCLTMYAYVNVWVSKR